MTISSSGATRAAVPAVVGALVGVTFCYAGGNIGDGPGWWVVVFSAGAGDGDAVRGVAGARRSSSHVRRCRDDRSRSGGRRAARRVARGVRARARPRRRRRLGVGGADRSSMSLPALPAVIVVLVVALVVGTLARPTPRAAARAAGPRRRRARDCCISAIAWAALRADGMAGMTAPVGPGRAARRRGSSRELRRRAIFDCCKWDPQVGDACAIARHRRWSSRARRGTRSRHSRKRWRRRRWRRSRARRSARSCIARSGCRGASAARCARAASAGRPPEPRGSSGSIFISRPTAGASPKRTATCRAG